jgi:hypothetical protein
MTSTNKPNTTRARRLAWMGAAAVAAVVAALAGPASAASYPDYVKTACKQDFKKFCRSYDIESASMRQCMRRSVDNLSRRCTDALERSGERRSGRR